MAAFRREPSRHQGPGNVPNLGNIPASEPVDRLRPGDVVCQESLGGLLKYYELMAA